MTEHDSRKKGRGDGNLGAFLCWAVVFADIGTSVYYTPGILFGQVGVHAAIFVAMTLIVFVLLTLKYREVAVRYPEGGGVVTVASQAIHPFAGALGGMFILVDYFLTAAISALSGLIYLSLVVTSLKPYVLMATIVALGLLVVLNLVGISASAGVTAVFATLAGASQLLVVAAVLIHFGPSRILSTVPKAFSGPHLTGLTILTGYAGAFLAFSGLESIAQLAPAMRPPRRRVSHLAMGAVVVTIALTSPLLTLWSTTLLNARHSDPNQFISLLGGYAAGRWLQTEVAVTAATLLIFASNTAVIGSYHVFLALSKMKFLPDVLEHRNTRRNTPHWAILTAIAAPIAVLLASRGNVGILGDLYAFGLLGAFSMTCVGIDIVRWHERHPGSRIGGHSGEDHEATDESTGSGTSDWPPVPSRLVLVTGIFTTASVVLAWSVNLFAKPMATLFGGGVTIFGLGIAFVTYRVETRQGRPPVFPLLHREGQPFFFLSRARKARPAAVLVILPRDERSAKTLVEEARKVADSRPIVFLLHGTGDAHTRPAKILEIVDPYQNDSAAQRALGNIEVMGRKLGLDRRYIYLPSTSEGEAVVGLWEALRPEQTLVLEGDEGVLAHVRPRDVYRSPSGKTHILHYVT